MAPPSFTRYQHPPRAMRSPCCPQVWRTPYQNESLMFNPVTFDAISDTNPGYKDPSGAVQTAGPSFRHRRACAGDQPCDEIYAAYPDNCRVPRYCSQALDSVQCGVNVCTCGDAV
jgi:hypothetical protein